MSKSGVADISLFLENVITRKRRCNPLVVVAVTIGRRFVVLGYRTDLVEHRVGDALLLRRERDAVHPCAAQGVGLAFESLLRIDGAAEHGPAVGLLAQHAAMHVVCHPAELLAVKPNLGQTVQPVVCEVLRHVRPVVLAAG